MRYHSLQEFIIIYFEDWDILYEQTAQCSQRDVGVLTAL